jgi:glutamate synthase domain-containing protein 1
MHDLSKVSNPFGDDKVIAACSLFGMMNLRGERFSGRDIIKAIANMHIRGNGLGGGFAVYGIYPKYKNYYALHIMYLSRDSKKETDGFLTENFDIVNDEEVPTREIKGITNPPLVWRYFVTPKKQEISENDYVMQKVMSINTKIKDAFVLSSGKDMGVFKGVGYPEDIGRYFRLEEYEGYLWTAHGRFPTNTQGWWGGAHPFNILDWTVVHNGEISSYGTNRRYLEMYGYNCTLQTDTEVMAYAVDLLIRRHKLSMEIAAKIFTPPVWSQIEHMGKEECNFYTMLRQAYSPLLINGPFTVIIAHHGEMIGLTDRIRLRPLTAGISKDVLYLSSEESAIRLICPELESSWIPKGGEPIIGRLGTNNVLYENKKLIAAEVRQ